MTSRVQPIEIAVGKRSFNDSVKNGAVELREIDLDFVPGVDYMNVRPKQHVVNKLVELVEATNLAWYPNAMSALKFRLGGVELGKANRALRLSTFTLVSQLIKERQYRPDIVEVDEDLYPDLDVVSRLDNVDAHVHTPFETVQLMSLGYSPGENLGNEGTIVFCDVGNLKASDYYDDFYFTEATLKALGRFAPPCHTPANLPCYFFVDGKLAHEVRGVQSSEDSRRWLTFIGSVYYPMRDNCVGDINYNYDDTVNFDYLQESKSDFISGCSEDEGDPDHWL